jgi:putative hemin transport protein
MCTDGQRCRNCPAKRITAGPTVIAETLPALGMVVAVTANDAALLSHTGEYLPAALPGEALRCGDSHISLRVNPNAVNDIRLTPRALTLAGEFGTHRAYFTPMSDHLAVQALQLAPTRRPAPAAPLDWSALTWRDADQITHLDALTPERYRVLPFTGARQVETRALPHLLELLCRNALPLTVAVAGGGCLQLHRGAAAMVEHVETHTSVVFGAARYAVDPAMVAECWVTQAHGATGLTSAVELYDHSHRCVTVLTQTGPICGHLGQAWEDIVASLTSPQSA